MELIAFTLVLAVSIQCANGGSLIFNPINALPWTRDMPKEEYEKHVNLRLVKKDWFPTGGVPAGELSPGFPSVDEAYAIFRNKLNQYQFYESTLQKAVELMKENNEYNSELPSIFVIHTISGNGEADFVTNTVTALALRKYTKEYNVFTFDMPGMQSSMEQTIIKSIFGQKANYVDFGETLGRFFLSAIKEGLIKPNQIHLFGFCYSSQLAGFVARYITSKTDNQKIASITALDPYSIGLSGIRNTLLSKNDAQVVHAFHTNSIAYGTLYRQATADFSLNSGMAQPGCYASKSVMCSHRRAVTAFWYVILYPDLWQARQCSSWIMFKTCLCNKKEIVTLTFPPRPGPSGKFFLNTKAHKPYGFGRLGANCYSSDKNEGKPAT